MQAMKESQGVDPLRQGTAVTRSTINARYTGSMPLNYGTPAVPPALGPRWQLLGMAGSGSREAEALPLTSAWEWEEQIVWRVNSGCVGIEAQNFTQTTVVRGRGNARYTFDAGGTVQNSAQGFMQINGPLTSYSVAAGVSPGPSEIVTTVRKVDHCAGDRVTNETRNSTQTPQIGASINVQDVPLPATPAGLRGTRMMPWRFGTWNDPATYEWTIAPIAAR
jgi:hypothetical protein